MKLLSPQKAGSKVDLVDGALLADEARSYMSFYVSLAKFVSN